MLKIPKSSKTPLYRKDVIHNDGHITNSSPYKIGMCQSLNRNKRFSVADNSSNYIDDTSKVNKFYSSNISGGSKAKIVIK